MYTRQELILLMGLAVVAVTNAQQYCYTPHSNRGQCISLYQCPAMLNFIEARRLTGLTWDERQFVAQSQCFSNYGQHPHVCCYNDDPFLQTQATTRRPIVEQQQPATGGGNLLPNPADYQCGRDIFSNRIYGGENAELGEFPWMALLEYQNSRGARDFACGGSLINSRYVLTVSHCLVGKIEQVKGQLINVRLGEHNLDTSDDCEMHDGTRICSDPVRDIRVESKIPHPDYLPNDRNQYNDIGLVRLGQSVTYTEFIQPICLPYAQLRTQAGRNVTVSGWGRTLNSRKSAIKQQISIPVADQQQCRNIFNSNQRTSVHIQDTQLCAGGDFVRDSCDGDSGGPLMALSNSLWYAEGLVSFGNGCGLDGWPGVYTRVSQYLDWINSVLEP